MKLYEQIENHLSIAFSKRGVKRRSNKWVKSMKHRVERRRANVEPECMPCYRKYCGWEW